MLLVGGGAVNFHGYKRHSADVDFWIKPTTKNLEKLRLVLNEMGYCIESFPAKVVSGQQNISIKVSRDQELELITAFNLGKTFNEAWALSIKITIHDYPLAKYRVLDFETLIESKVKSGRPKDFLDIQELKRLKD